MSISVDQIIKPRWIAPVAKAAPAGMTEILEDHSIIIESGRIVALLPAEQAERDYLARSVIDLPDHLVTPGLINLHTHAGMTLLRGTGADLPLDTWLRTRIWPLEKALMSADFVRDGTQLACLEMLMGGITCFNDMYFYPDAAVEAALSVGMRIAAGIVVIDFPTAWASDADDYLAKGLAVRDALRDEQRVSFCLAPHAPYTVSDATLSRIAVLAGQLNLPIHMHVHETCAEIEEGLRKTGIRPLERLRRLGLVGPQFIAVHAVHLEEAEIDLLATHGATIAHCPTSNLKLASGIAPIHECLAANVRIGLGTDSAASNDRLDILGEMRLAALLAKGKSGDASALNAHASLRAATLNAASALGLENRIGSIESGKQADLAAFDLSALQPGAGGDPLAQLLYAGDRSNTTHVWVDGHLVVEKRQFTQANCQAVMSRHKSTISLWSAAIHSTIDQPGAQTS